MYSTLSFFKDQSKVSDMHVSEIGQKKQPVEAKLKNKINKVGKKTNIKYLYLKKELNNFDLSLIFKKTIKGIRKKIKNNAFVDIANTKSIIINLKNVICFYKFTLELNKISIEKKIDIKTSIWPAISIPYSATLLNLTKKSIKIRIKKFLLVLVILLLLFRISIIKKHTKYI